MNKVALATLSCIACLFPIIAIAQGLAKPYQAVSLVELNREIH